MTNPLAGAVPLAVVPKAHSEVPLGLVAVDDDWCSLWAIDAAVLTPEGWGQAPALAAISMDPPPLDPDACAAAFWAWNESEVANASIEDLALTLPGPWAPWSRPFFTGSTGHWFDTVKRMLDTVELLQEVAPSERLAALGKASKAHPWLVLWPGIARAAWPGGPVDDLDTLDAAWMLTSLLSQGLVRGWTGRGSWPMPRSTPDKLDLYRALLTHPELAGESVADREVSEEHIADFVHATFARTAERASVDDGAGALKALQQRERRQRPEPTFILPDLHGLALTNVRGVRFPRTSNERGEALLRAQADLSRHLGSASGPESRLPTIQWLRTDRALRLIEILGAGKPDRLRLVNAGAPVEANQLRELTNLPHRHVSWRVHPKHAAWSTVADLARVQRDLQLRPHYWTMRECRRNPDLGEPWYDEASWHPGKTVAVRLEGFCRDWEDLLSQVPLLRDTRPHERWSLG